MSSVEFRINGAATLHKVAAQFRAQANKDLSRDLSNALSKAIEPVKTAIKASAEETMPREGGYNPTFSRALKFRTNRNTRGSDGSVTLSTYAEGKTDRRDIRALERGDLRHPLFGHRKRAWYTTPIRAGFHRRGTDKALDEAQKEISKVADDFLKHLT